VRSERREEAGRGESHRSGGRKQSNQPIGHQIKELKELKELIDEAKGESKWQVKTQQYLAFIRIAQL
jgi:hypothetical protein